MRCVLPVIVQKEKRSNVNRIVRRKKGSIENEPVIKEMQMNEEKDTGLVPKDGTSDYSSW
jgi:hypothetical protein